MKEIREMLAVLMLMAFIFSTIALARGAPTGQNAFTDQAIVSVHVAPTVANVPPMTVGYDVIENITTAPHVANVTPFATDTSETLRLSPTVAWRNLQSVATYSARSGPSPNLVMLV